MAGTTTSGAGQAVVVGASVAGLLAAAALAPHYAEVLVLDRDRLPLEPVPRGGVPHARHCHVLLEPGCSAIETLLPGALAQLAGARAPTGDSRGRVVSPAHAGLSPLTPGGSGSRAVSVERELLEARLRERVAGLPSVRLRSRATVLGLVTAQPGRLDGVVVADLDHPDLPARPVHADLVVDACGRGSRLLECLAAHGCPVPPLQRHRIDGLNVTRRFTLPPDVQPSGLLAERDVAVVGTPGPQDGWAIVAPVGDRHWLVSLAGYRGTRPPPDLPGFTAYARATGGPIAALIEQLQPVGGPISYREPALLRRRFEQLPAPPAGLVVVGDALCTVDAASGAGMSAAAMQAVALRDTIRDGLDDLPHRYFQRTAGLLDQLWDGASRRHGAPAV